ncbi:FAD-dependent oxidoreductase [Gymnodinialimonas sp.]
MDCDVAIIGGGPAGAAAALTLRKRPDISVVVVERGSYATPKIGESLSPGTRALLQYLGVWERFQRDQTLRLFGSEAAWGQDALGSMDFMLTTHGAGWALDRRQFDEMLAEEAARAGAKLRTGTRVKGCERLEDGWRIETDQGALTARYVIDAGGRASPFALATGAQRQRNDALTAIFARLPRSYTAPQMSRVESVEHGWWYGAPLPSGETILCLFADAEGVHRLGLSAPDVWMQHLAQTRHISAMAKPPTAPPKLEVQSAFSALLTGHDASIPLIATGDAMAARDPLSSSGIPNAIGGGIQAARVAADYLFGDGQLRQGYLHSVTLDHQAYLRTHWATYAREARWPDAPFWRFRTARVTRAPEIAVRQAPGAQSSIFVPGPVAAWIAEAARTPLRQVDLARAARATFPDLADDRLLLAIEDLTQPA